MPENASVSNVMTNLAYLAAAAAFVVGLKMLAHPRTAVRGNLIAAAGMLLAVIATVVHRQIIAYPVILAGLAIGSAIGAVMALRVRMTAMPQMVALLNGFGGGASALVAAAAIHESVHLHAPLTIPSALAAGLSGLIGSVTLTGSLVAWAKLEDLRLIRDPVLFPGQHALNAILLFAAVILLAVLTLDPTLTLSYWAIVGVAGLLGILLVMPIGGADMPVVIALLNAYSGLAAAATGFVLANTALIIAGSLVGTSGLILTHLMCRAMNRSLANVLFAGVGAPVVRSRPDDVYASVKAASAEDVALLLDSARRVMVVPGYGMAVAQAQHAVRDLADLLEARGIDVRFAIHPVAGRMPGHMNVLLAEANVPYDKLLEMEPANAIMDQVDVAIVLGANDVVNPLARTDSSSPIAGMPIIDVDRARSVVVIKRSLAPGFAGIPNPLFAAANTLMFFADGEKAVRDLIAALKDLAPAAR